MALFESREDFDKKMISAGLTNNNCAYRAVNSVVSFAGGVNIYDVDEVAKELADVGYEPLLIEKDVSENVNVMKRKADVMCAACGMCVTIVGGYTDVQSVALQREERDCPVFSVT
jgi:hypothetical protein